MPAEQSAEFKAAVEQSRKLKAKPTNDELLEVCSPSRILPRSNVH